MDQQEFDVKKIEFEHSMAQRNFEIDNFWKRSWFFGALLLALGSAFIKIKIESHSNEYYEYLVCIALIGFAVSLIQSLMCRGSKYWQERWEFVTKNRESALQIDVTIHNKFAAGNERYYIDASIRAKHENPLLRSWRVSVSKLTIVVWDIITLTLFLNYLNELQLFNELLYSFCGCRCCNDLQISKVIFFHLFIITYLVIFLSNAKLAENLVKSKKESSKNRSENSNREYDSSSQHYQNNDLSYLNSEEEDK